MIFRELGTFSIYNSSLCLRIHYSRLSAAKGQVPFKKLSGRWGMLKIIRDMKEQ